MDIVAGVDVGLATDVVLAAIGTVERASLVGTETIADEECQLRGGAIAKEGSRVDVLARRVARYDIVAVAAHRNAHELVLHGTNPSWK